jgi:NitT/TauT family transport system substrate-binding protein
LLLISRGAWHPFASAAPAATPIRIALSSTPHAALLYIAMARGYFAEEGLPITIVPATHGKAALDLLAQGKADFATAAEVPFVISVLQGERLRVVATVASVSSEMAVVARRDRNIVKPAGLAGKRVGVTPGTSGEYYLWAFLIRHMISPDDVSLVAIAPGQMPQQLADGTQIDAVSTWEPVKSAARDALGANGVMFSESDSYTVTHVVIGTSGFIATHGKEIDSLLRALLKAEAYARADPALAQGIVAEQLKLDPKTVRAGWNDLTLRVDLRQSQLVTLEDQARWAMARGHSPAGVVPNFLPRLYLDGLLAIQPDRVTVVH